MKFKLVPVLIVAGALAAGFMVYRRQQAGASSTEGDAPDAAQGFSALFSSMFGGAGAATAPATNPAPANGTATDNGT